jgi:TniQ
MPQSQRDLLVVSRPHAGEALSSWLARIAGVYGLAPQALVEEELGWSDNSLREIDLNPPSDLVLQLARLTRSERRLVEVCTIRGAHPQWLEGWVTSERAYWNTTERKTVIRAGTQFHVCWECLDEDLEQGSQFIRLEWLCAASTICSRHLTFLQPFSVDHSPPFDCQTNRNHARFKVYTNPGIHAPLLCTKTKGSIRALSGFEQCVKRSLSQQEPASWMFMLKPHELNSVVYDLTWALLQPIGADGTRLAHHLETEAFRVPRGWRTPTEVCTLSQLDVSFRRAILATIACLLFPAHYSDLAQTFQWLSRADTCRQVLQLLGSERAKALLALDHRWPAFFRRRMRQATW